MDRPGSPGSSVWPILHYDDTRAALRFLVDVLGFRQALAVADERGDIVHAELRWPGGGALVFGGTKHTDGVHGEMWAGASALYVVTDDVAAVHQRVRDARGVSPCSLSSPAGPVCVAGSLVVCGGRPVSGQREVPPGAGHAPQRASLAADVLRPAGAPVPPTCPVSPATTSGSRRPRRCWLRCWTTWPARCRPGTTRCG